MITNDIQQIIDRLTHGCGNHGCRIRPVRGMGTNSICRCLEDCRLALLDIYRANEDTAGDGPELYQKASSVHIVADGRLVGMVWPGAEGMTNWRVGGGNAFAATRKEAVEAVLRALDKS